MWAYLWLQDQLLLKNLEPLPTLAFSWSHYQYEWLWFGLRLKPFSITLHTQLNPRLLTEASNKIKNKIGRVNCVTFDYKPVSIKHKNYFCFYQNFVFSNALSDVIDALGFTIFNRKITRKAANSMKKVFHHYFAILSKIDLVITKNKKKCSFIRSKN